MCEGNCCNNIGSSPAMQIWYIAACAIYGFGTLIAVCLLLADVNGEAFLELISLGAFVTLILMLASRCWTPCCCPNDMPDVPHPCPLGECTLSNPKCLDYPLLIAFMGDAALNVLLEVMWQVMAWSEDSDDWHEIAHTLKYVRLLNLILVGFAFLGVFTGLRRWAFRYQRTPSLWIELAVWSLGS